MKTRWARGVLRRGATGIRRELPRYEPGSTMEYLRTHPEAARRLKEALAASREGRGRTMTMAELRAFVARVSR